MPIITLTTYWGGKTWDAPRSLKEMFPENISPEILKEVDDYRLHLIIPTEIKDFSVFQTEFGKAMKYIAASEDPEKIQSLYTDNAFQNVSVETVQLINQCTNSNFIIPKGVKDINMCKGIEEFKKQQRIEGRVEGRLEGVIETLTALEKFVITANFSCFFIKTFLLLLVFLFS